MKKILIALAFIGSLLQLGGAQTAPATGTTSDGVPQIIADGFNSFKTGSYATAVVTWSRGSNLELDVQATTGVQNTLSHMQNVGGSYVGPELIKIVSLSTSTELVYVDVKYQRGMVFMCFTCMKPADKWLITSITADADPTKILPTNILSGN
ncbi:MAG TPA: hypothetical protein VK737_11025 [Opitutales bacterium]|jgi:hypothetical protein|nr:hypothetical protein [Opitutales bacterium]